MKTKLFQIAHALVLGGAAVAAAVPAQAGMGLLTSAAQQAATSAPSRQRVWTLGEFSEVRLVPAEAGAQGNQHPAQVPLELLAAQLRTVRTQVADLDVPLFSDSELKDLVEVLAKALSVAAPSDDIVFVSAARRDDGTLFVPMAVTARLFVQGGALQLIVRDARVDFFDRARGTHLRPVFEFGGRATPGRAVLRSVAASAVKRPDWLELPLAMPAPVPPVIKAAVVLPGGAMPAPAVLPPSAAPAAAAGVAATAPAAAAPRAGGPASAEEIEQRLVTLKRLRERGLISEDEYQQKRKDILSLL